MTKWHEEIIQNTLEELIQRFEQQSPKENASLYTPLKKMP